MTTIVLRSRHQSTMSPARTVDGDDDNDVTKKKKRVNGCGRSFLAWFCPTRCYPHVVKCQVDGQVGREREVRGGAGGTRVGSSVVNLGGGEGGGGSVEGAVILVTGGAGFLGQHIVRLLQERSTGVREIRVLDTNNYVNRLGHKETVPVRGVVGDVSCLSDVRKAMAGVDTVIHTAGLISFGTFPNITAMEQVNVTGTANVVQACVEHNVSRLVYTSTIDVVIGYDDVINGDESLEIPRRHLFIGYPATKTRAEEIVMQANGRKLARGDGSVLHTLSLRPNIMFGELDPYYVTTGLRSANQNKGILMRVGNGTALFQQAYVGNVAWAHLCAASALMNDPDIVSGRSYFVTDSTPLLNTFEFMRPFLAARQFRLSGWSLPYPLVYVAFLLIDTALTILRPIYEINLQFCNSVLMASKRGDEVVRGGGEMEEILIDGIELPDVTTTSPTWNDSHRIRTGVTAFFSNPQRNGGGSGAAGRGGGGGGEEGGGGSGGLIRETKYGGTVEKQEINNVHPTVHTSTRTRADSSTVPSAIMMYSPDIPSTAGRCIDGRKMSNLANYYTLIETEETVKCVVSTILFIAILVAIVLVALFKNPEM